MAFPIFCRSSAFMYYTLYILNANKKQGRSGNEAKYVHLSLLTHRNVTVLQIVMWAYKYYSSLLLVFETYEVFPNDDI